MAVADCGRAELRQARRRAWHVARVALPVAYPDVLVRAVLGQPLSGVRGHHLRNRDSRRVAAARDRQRLVRLSGREGLARAAGPPTDVRRIGGPPSGTREGRLHAGPQSDVACVGYGAGVRGVAVLPAAGQVPVASLMPTISSSRSLRSRLPGTFAVAPPAGAVSVSFNVPVISTRFPTNVAARPSFGPVSS